MVSISSCLKVGSMNVTSILFTFVIFSAFLFQSGVRGSSENVENVSEDSSLLIEEELDEEYTVEERDAKAASFGIWVPFHKGFSSVTVELGHVLPIRCRVSVSGIEWTDDVADLKLVNMTFFKDGKELPISSYFTNKTLAAENNVIVHSNAAFDYLAAEEFHRGLYECRGAYNDQQDSAEFLVRVKEDQPLWPALVLGVQVITLCIIYFLYEQHLKRQEAKWNEDQ